MKFTLLRKFFSFVWPIRIELSQSEYNPVLEVVYYHGKLQLNSKNANYSFGPLHDVLHRAIKLASKDLNCRFGTVLLLGYGGGSAANIIHEDYYENARITAVEIDAEVIRIANKYFYARDILFKCMAAEKYIAESKDTFDLIISDIFIDNQTPPIFKTESFYLSILKLLNPKGVFIQNLILTEEEAIGQKVSFGKYFSQSGQFHMYGNNVVLLGKK